jgi:hypothetical protein
MRLPRSLSSQTLKQKKKERAFPTGSNVLVENWEFTLPSPTQILAVSTTCA